MQDRRVFVRLGLKCPLKFLNSRNGKEGLGEALNISASGIGLITKEELSPKTELEIWLKVPGENRYLHMQGDVVWSKPPDNLTDQRQAGIQLHLDEEKFMDLGRVLRAK